MTHFNEELMLYPPTLNTKNSRLEKQHKTVLPNTLGQYERLSLVKSILK